MIGSMTKMITALSVMQLSEKGALSVHQKIEDYLPDFYSGQGITLHHLLNHTSGIPNFVLMKNRIEWDKPHTPQEILRIVKEHKQKFSSGKKWMYSNTNYLILGLIIEKASSMSYHEYVKEHIFAPAGMKDSGFNFDGLENVAVNYVKGQKGFFMDSSMFFACGDVVSTIGDLSLLNTAIQEGKLLRPETVAEMQKPQYDGKHQKYGYGLCIKNLFDRKSVGHSGSVPSGYTSHFENYLDDGISIIVLSNDLQKYSLLAIKELGATYISRELASLIYDGKLNLLDKMM